MALFCHHLAGFMPGQGLIWTRSVWLAGPTYRHILYAKSVWARSGSPPSGRATQVPTEDA